MNTYSTIQLANASTIDPLTLPHGTLFRFEYRGSPTLVLMRLKDPGFDGAIVLARNPAEGAGCSDKVGSLWEAGESLTHTNCGAFHPFDGSVTITQNS